jgi:DNA-binding IclR family transcriptional regulator
MKYTNRERLDCIWHTVEREPGIKAGGVARRLGLHRSAVARALPAMEDAGLLLREDSKGGLWPFGWRR